MKRLSPVTRVALLALFLGLLDLPRAAFMADDFLQLSVLEGVSPVTWVGPLDLYTLSDGDPGHNALLREVGAFPWFVPPNFKMAFFRPLSSALLVADHAIFGLSPFGYRAHSLLWFVLLVIGIGLLLRRTLPGP